MYWIVEIPKYDYGYSYNANPEKHKFKTEQEADEFCRKLHAHYVKYKESGVDCEG